MFICQDCLKKKYKPYSMAFVSPRSKGACESCGNTDICLDIQSDKLEPVEPEEKFTPEITDIYQLREKLLRRDITEIKSLRVYNSEGHCIMEAATPNRILETQEKYFKATSGIVQFGQAKNWKFQQKAKRVLVVARTLGVAKLVIEFQL